MALAAWPAHAAIAVVQTVSCSAAFSTSCTTGAVTTTNGNLFVASAGYCCAPSAFVSISDNKSNTFTDSIAEVTQDLTQGRQQYKAVGTGGASHTFTLTGSDGNFIATLSVQEVSGAAAVPLDKTASLASPGPATSFSSGSTAATSQAAELLIGFGSSQDTTTYTNDGGAGWTEQTNVATNGVNIEGLITGSKVVAATGTYAYTFTTGSSARAVAGISTWKESSGTRQRCIGCGTDRKVIGDR